MTSPAFRLIIIGLVFSGCLCIFFHWRNRIRKKLLDCFHQLNQSYDGEIKSNSLWLGQYPEFVIRNGQALVSLRPTSAQGGFTSEPSDFRREPAHTVITTVINDPSYEIRCDVRTKGILSKLINTRDMENLGNDYPAMVEHFHVETNNASFIREFLSPDIQQNLLDLRHTEVSFFIGSPFGPMTLISVRAKGIITELEKLEKMINIQLKCIAVLRKMGVQI